MADQTSSNTEGQVEHTHENGLDESCEDTMEEVYATINRLHEALNNGQQNFSRNELRYHRQQLAVFREFADILMQLG